MVEGGLLHCKYILMTLDDIRIRMRGMGKKQFNLRDVAFAFRINESTALKMLEEFRLEGKIRILNYKTFLMFEISDTPEEIKANLRENIKAFEKELRKYKKLVSKARELYASYQPETESLYI